MSVNEMLLTNGAFGYPRGSLRHHMPHILAVVHQTSTTPYDGQAMVLRDQRNGANYIGNTATYYIDPDGGAVHAVDGTHFASWGSAPESIAYLDTSRASMALVKRHFDEGANPNECVWEQIECVGQGADPWTDAQFDMAAQIIAARAGLSGLAITRETVVPHRDMNTVNRPSDPWPAATREARMARLIDRARELAITAGPMQGADMIDPTADIPAALCDVLPGGPLMAADRTTQISASWPGGTGIGLYSRPELTKGFAAIRIQRSVGGALELAWTPNNRVVNVRTPGPDPTPFDQAHVDEEIAKAVAAVPKTVVTMTHGATTTTLTPPTTLTIKVVQ